jgi:hypothetical protein
MVHYYIHRRPATCLYLDSDQSNPRLPSHFLKILFNIIVPLMCMYDKSAEHLIKVILLRSDDEANIDNRTRAPV